MSAKKVFISWSGDKSKKLASAIRDWLPAVIQAIRPYFSPDDIVKGSRWSTEITNELAQCSVGIICMTRDNLNSSWIMFEAGALSKQLGRSRVCPVIFELKPTDISGPLSQFQAANFEASEIFRVLEMINAELEDKLPETVLRSVFDMWWPRLKEKVDSILSEYSKPVSGNEPRSDRELLEEILTIARSPISRISGTDFFGENVENLVKALESLTTHICKLGLSEELYDDLRKMRTAIIFMLSINNSALDSSLKLRLDASLAELEKSLPSSNTMQAFRKTQRIAEQDASADAKKPRR